MPIISQGLDYNVDIVMCIDATGSMGPIINDVKANALSFYQKFGKMASMQTSKPAEVTIDLRGAGHSEHIGSDIVVCDVDQDDDSQRYDNAGKSFFSEFFL